MKKLLSCLILGSLLFTVNSFAQDKEVDVSDKYPYMKVLDTLTYVETLTQPIKRKLRESKVDLNFFAGLLQGFDSNVNLDKDKKKDGFSDTSLNTEAIYNYTDDIRLRVENDTSYILYYTRPEATILDIDTEAGLETDLLDDMFTVGADYGFGYVMFPSDKDGTYISNRVRTFLKNNITPNLYHKISYKFMHKDFSHYKTRNSNRIRIGTLRKDNRNGIDYEVGVYLFDRAILRANVECYYNESNYKYFHYYDYWSVKIRPSAIYMITDKLYASGSFTYQQRNYDDRLSSEDDEHVYDDTYSFSASLLYDITNSFTAAINFYYIENVSNEPLQEYTGGTISAGIYYSF